MDKVTYIEDGVQRVLPENDIRIEPENFCCIDGKKNKHELVNVKIPGLPISRLKCVYCGLSFDFMGKLLSGQMVSRWNKKNK